MKHAPSNEAIKCVMLSVYDGKTHLGFVFNRGKIGYEALDINEKSLGIFPDEKSAADAVSEGAP